MRTQFTKKFHSTKRHGTGTISFDFQIDNHARIENYLLLDGLLKAFRNVKLQTCFIGLLFTSSLSFVLIPGP